MAKKKKKGNYLNWLVPGCVILVLLLGVGFLVKVFLAPAGEVRKNQVSVVTLLKPPPPPDTKEKPPEQEVQKAAPKETMSTPTEAQQPQNQADQSDSPPPGADLGVDAEGGAGGDGFGLVGKKGGKALSLGGGGPGGSGGSTNRLSLMTKYGWYTAKIQEELKRQMRKRLDENGGIPKGKLQATVKLTLDSHGTVIKYQIIASSGDVQMDEALKASLPGFKISQPPPDGMPAGMTLRISSQG